MNNPLANKVIKIRFGAISLLKTKYIILLYVYIFFMQIKNDLNRFVEMIRIYFLLAAIARPCPGKKFGIQNS